MSLTNDVLGFQELGEKISMCLQIIQFEDLWETEGSSKIGRRKEYCVFNKSKIA